MSQENVDIVRRAIEATRDGLEAGLEHMHPEIRVDWTRSEGPLTGIYEGLDGFRKLFGDMTETFDGSWMEPHEFIPAGPYVVVPNTSHFRGRHGVDVIARGTIVCTVRDGKIASMTLFQTQGQALEAVGLSE